MKRCILSSLLAASMILSTVPAYALAIDDVIDVPESASAIILTSVGTEENPTQVKTAEELIEAVNTSGYVQLMDNIELDSTLTIPENSEVVLDLNGKTMTLPGTETRKIRNDGVLTIKDSIGTGVLKNIEEGSYGLIDNYNTLTIKGGTFENYGRASGAAIKNRPGATLLAIESGTFKGMVEDEGGNQNGYATSANVIVTSEAPLVVTGGTFSSRALYAPVFKIFNGGTTDIRNATVSTYKAGGIEVSGANDPVYLTDCSFNVSDVNSYYANAVAVSNDGELFIDGGSYEGYKYAAYVYNSGGTINIKDGIFEAQTVLKADNSQYDTQPSVINVTGGAFTGTFDIGSKATLAVYGGTFSNDVTEYIDPSSGFQEVNGQYIVKPIPESEGVAAIGDKYYRTLDAALKAAKDGEAVKLLADATQNITLNRPITIDGQNQYTITGDTRLQNGTLKNLTLTTTGSSLLTIGSADKNNIRMEGVTVKYPVTGTNAGTVSVAGGNNADIVITGCTFMNEPNNNGVTENAPEWSYGLYMNEQGTDGSFTFENSRFDGAFRTMLANINGSVSVTGSTFVNSIFSNNSGSTSGSGEEATCITTANADVSGISITGNTFDNAGAFYFQKTEGAEVADNTFQFDRFEHFIQVRGGAAHALDLSDNTFEMGNNDLVSIDVAAAPIIYPVGQKAVSYWAWAGTANSRPADYSSYVYAYNADGSKTFYPESNAALNAFLNPNAGNIGVAAKDAVKINHNLTLTGDTMIPEDATLVINEDVTLTVPEGTTLTNNGTIVNPDRINGAVSSGESAVSKSSVTFEVYPEYADIVVMNADGETVASVSDGLYYLEDGSYTYKISAEGYSDKSQNFVVNKAAQTISVTLKKISSGGASHPEAGSSSSSSSNRYEIEKPSKVENGSIKVSTTKAEKGDIVTITVTPDEGYALDELAVYDEDGDKIDLKDKGDGKFTFEMPKGDVEIEVSFVAIADEAPKADFADVAADAWYADAVQYVFENGMMSGTSETTFSPNLTTTRGMIVTILYRLEGTPDLSNENLGYPYADVDADAYYTDAIYWARQHGIISGISAEQFAPNSAITREQMAAILYRYAQFKGYDVSVKADLSVYTDAASVGTYATDAMAWANGAELITGTSATTLSPADNATRAQVAAILMRFCENIAK